MSKATPKSPAKSPAKSTLPDKDKDGADWIAKGHQYLGKPVRVEGSSVSGQIVKYAMESRHPWGGGSVFHAAFESGPLAKSGTRLTAAETAEAIKLHQTKEKEERMAARAAR